MKKRILVLMAIVFGLALTFTLAGCGGGDGSPTGSGGGGGGGPGGLGYANRGWPSGSVLSKYGIGGMGSPTGASNFYWAEDPENDGSDAIAILFNATDSTTTFIRNWFSSNGWTENTYGMGADQYSFFKQDPIMAASYSFYRSDGYAGLGVAK